MDSHAFTGIELCDLNIQEHLYEVFQEFDELICVLSHRVSAATVFDLKQWKTPTIGVKPKPKKEFFALPSGYKIGNLKRHPSMYAVFTGGRTTEQPLKHMIALVSPQRAGVVIAQWFIEDGASSQDFAVCPVTANICVPNQAKGRLTLYDTIGRLLRVILLPPALNYFPQAGQFTAVFGSDHSFTVRVPTSGGVNPAARLATLLTDDHSETRVGLQQTFAAAKGNGLTVFLLNRPHSFMTIAYIGKNAPVYGKPSRYYYNCDLYNDDLSITRSFSLASGRLLRTSHVHCDVRAGFLLCKAAGGLALYYDIREA